ncbi:6577_t:CDS:2, partial [Gigaspora rosea]
MTLNLENFLLKDIKNLFNDPNYSNVVIQVGRHPDTNSFKAHSLILRARSSYFRSILKTNDGQVSTLNIPDISPGVFEHILNGTINLNYTPLRPIYFELLIASSDLKLTELIDHIQSHLLTNDIEWIHANLLKLLYLTFTHTSEEIKDFFFAKIPPTKFRQLPPRIIGDSNNENQSHVNNQ